MALPSRPGFGQASRSDGSVGEPSLAPSGDVDSGNLPDRLRRIEAELAAVFLERHEPVRILLVSLLALAHPFLLGPPGTSKSALLRELCSRITDAKYYEVLCDRNLPLESLFGAIDLKAYEATGDWRRKMEGYLPTAHVAFLDEVGKAGPVALNPLLGAMNERIVRNGDEIVHIPLLMMAGASNELLDPELAALWDRFLIRMSVDYLAEDSAFASLMSSAVIRPGMPTAIRTTVRLDELVDAAYVRVPAVPVPNHVIADLTSLRRALKTEGVSASDRRWKQSIRLLQSSAWLDGRPEVDRSDLTVLLHSLWTTEPDIPVVRNMVLNYEPVDARELRELEAQVNTIAGSITSRAGQPRTEKAQFGMKARADLVVVRDKAGRIDGDRTRAAAIQARCDQLIHEVLVNVLNMTPSTAETVLTARR